MTDEATPLSSEQRQELPSNNSSWWPFRTKSQQEICREYCKSYQNKFPDITYIASRDLGSYENVTLVDVRTEPERRVSMLPGAVPLEEFTPTNQGDNLIVTYCTVGYRSGLEARRLGLQHPECKDRLRSLDGVVAYTHEATHLIDPSTGEPTQRVHTFGGMWASCVDPETFEATTFSLPELLVRLLQVMVAVISCSVLRIQSYCCQPRAAISHE